MESTDVVTQVGVVTLIFLLFSIAWLVVAGLALRLQTRRLHMRYEHEMRVLEVTTRFLASAKHDVEGNLDGLLKAGIWTLEDDREVRELCGRVEQYGEKNPLGQYRDRLEAVGLRRFFRAAADAHVDLRRPGAVDELLARLKGGQG